MLPSLANMVEAARLVRAELAAGLPAAPAQPAAGGAAPRRAPCTQGCCAQGV